MPVVRKRYFVFAQVPERYLPEFIKKMESDPRIGTVEEYGDVWFIGRGTEFSKPLPGANPVGDSEREPSVLWISSCEPEEWKGVLDYISEAHPWEVPVIFGLELDFPYPTKEERRDKQKTKVVFKE